MTCKDLTKSFTSSIFLRFRAKRGQEKFVKTLGGVNLNLEGFAIISVNLVLLSYLQNTVVHLDWTWIKKRTIWHRFDSKFLSYKIYKFQVLKSYWVFWYSQPFELSSQQKCKQTKIRVARYWSVVRLISNYLLGIFEQLIEIFSRTVNNIVLKLSF